MPDDDIDISAGYVQPKQPTSAASTRDKVFRKADAIGVPRDLVERLVHRESDWSHTSANGEVKRSPKNALGLFQVVPDKGTYRTVRGKQYDVSDEDQNIEAGLSYLKEGLDKSGGDPHLASLYYFGGPGALSRARKTGKIPSISDGGSTAAQYVGAVGGKPNKKVDISAGFVDDDLDINAGYVSSPAASRQDTPQQPALSTSGLPEDSQSAAPPQAPPEAAPVPTVGPAGVPLASAVSPMGDSAPVSPAPTGTAPQAIPAPPKIVMPTETTSEAEKKVGEDTWVRPPQGVSGFTGNVGRIVDRGPHAEAAYREFLQRNVPHLKGKAASSDELFKDESLATVFTKIQDFVQTNPKAGPREQTRALALMGIDFLRDPDTKGKQLPRVLHAAILQSQLKPDEMKALPRNLQQQIQQHRVQEAAAREQRSKRQAIISETKNQWIAEAQETAKNAAPELAKKILDQAQNATDKQVIEYAKNKRFMDARKLGEESLERQFGRNAEGMRREISTTQRLAQQVLTGDEHQKMVRQELSRSGPGLKPLEERLRTRGVPIEATRKIVAPTQAEIAERRLESFPTVAQGPIAASWEFIASQSHRIANIFDEVATKTYTTGGRQDAEFTGVNSKGDPTYSLKTSGESAPKKLLSDEHAAPLVAIGDFFRKQSQQLAQGAKAVSDHNDGNFFTYTLPKAGTTAGLTLAELAVLKKTTGASLGTVFGATTFVDNLDQSPKTQIKETVKAYLLGSFFEKLPDAALKPILAKLPLGKTVGDWVAGASEQRLQRLAGAPLGAVVGGGLAYESGKSKEGIIADSLVWAGIGGIPELMGLAKKVPERLARAETLPERVRDIFAGPGGLKRAVVFSEDGRRAASLYGDPKSGGVGGEEIPVATAEKYAKRGAESHPVIRVNAEEFEGILKTIKSENKLETKSEPAPATESVSTSLQKIKPKQTEVSPDAKQQIQQEGRPADQPNQGLVPRERAIEGRGSEPRVRSDSKSEEGAQASEAQPVQGESAVSSPVRTDEQVASEPTESLVNRTEMGEERNNAFAERKQAADKVAKSLRAGDVVTLDDGTRIEIIHNDEHNSTLEWQEEGNTDSDKVGVTRASDFSVWLIEGTATDRHGQRVVVPPAKIERAKPSSQNQGAGGPVERRTTPERRRTAERLVRERRGRRSAERTAETDALTGIGNRLALDKALPAAEADPDTSVVVFDANDLGKVNKLTEHGQEAGDKVIQSAANAIKQAAQEASVPDRVFRRGGDEFVALIPKDKADAVRTRAEQIMGEQVYEGTHGQTGEKTTARISLTGSVGENFKVADESLQGLKATRKGQAAPAPGIARVPVSQLNVDPARFQYKMNSDAKGATGSLSDVNAWNPDLAGTVMVWRDPKDGRDYVVNGHNRYDLAKRTGQQNVDVRYITAPDAKKARARGALVNIAEGQGTSLDAAKFFRDSGHTPDDLKAQGISLKRNIARDGLALSKLDPFVFNQVAQGNLSEEYGVQIGGKIESPDLQNQALKAIKAAEAKGRQISKSVVDEMLDAIGSAPRQTEIEGTLFGDIESERSLFTERAQVAASLKRQLSADKTLFGTAARQSERLAEGGTTVDVDRAKQLQESATEALGVFDRLKNRTGIISNILDEGARAVAGGKRPDVVAKEAYERIKSAVQTVLGKGTAGERAGGEEALGRSEEPRGQRSLAEDTGGKEETSVDVGEMGTGPSLGPGAASASEQFPEVKERKFGKRFVEDERIVQDLKDTIGTAKYYEPIPNDVTAADAKRLVNQRGLAQSINAIKDENNGLPFHVRSTMGQVVILRLNELYKKLKDAEPTDAEYVLDQATDLAEWQMDYGTRLGQGVQSFAMWARLTPAGKLLTFKRGVDKAVKRHQKAHGDEVKEIVRELDKAGEEEPDQDVLFEGARTIKKTLAEKAAEAKKDPKNLTIWEQYKDSIARQLFSFVNPKTKLTPPLQEFSNRLLTNVEPLIAKDKNAAKPDVYGQMREVVENFDKYKEAWNEAVSFIRKKYEKKSVQELAAVERRITDLHTAFQAKVFDKVFDAALKQAEINFNALARAHFAERIRTKDDLIRDIQQGIGLQLSPEDAAELAAKVTQKMEAKIIGARQAILENLAKKNKLARKVLPISERLVEAARIGVFNEQKFYEAAAERLGLPAYDSTVAAKILELAGKVEDAPEGMPRDREILALNKYIAKQKGFGVEDLPMGIYYGNILSGYNTHAVNTLDTALNIISEINGLVITNPRAALKIYGGMLRGFNEGKFDAMLALTEGRMVTEGKWMEAPRLMEIAKFGEKGGVPIKTGGKLGRVTKALAETGPAKVLNVYKYITRLLAASDALFFRAAKEARASLLASRMAQNEGLKGDAFDAKVRDILALNKRADFSAQAHREGYTGVEAKARASELMDMIRDKEVTADAADFAGEATYNHEPHGALGYASKAIGNWSQAYWPLKLFVPFTRIVANVTNRGLNYTPYGFKRAFFGYSGGERLTSEARNQMIVRAVLGTIGLALLWVLDAEEVITIHGGGPSDRERRRQLSGAGWRPYTIQIGDTYISYVYTPVGLGLSVVGNMRDSQRYHELEQKDAATRGAYAIARIGSTVFSQSFLSGLNRLFDALSEQPSESVNAVKQTLSSTTSAVLVPNFAKDMYRLFDNKAYQSNTLMQDLVRNTPFAAIFLKPTLNAFGEPVTVQRQRFFDVLTEDPAWRFVIKKGLRVPVPSRTTEVEKGRRITPEEYYDLLLKTGPRLKRWILAKQTRLDSLTEDDAQEELSRAASKITKVELRRLRERIKQEMRKQKPRTAPAKTPTRDLNSLPRYRVKAVS